MEGYDDGWLLECEQRNLAGLITQRISGPWLDLTVNDLRSTAAEARVLFPGMELYSVAYHIIHHTLGRLWSNRHVEQIGKLGRGGVRLDDARTESQALDLAKALWLLREVDGYDSFVDRIRERADLEAAVLEIECARILHGSGYALEFVKPTGKKRNDFEFRATKGEVTVFIEVKGKRDTTALSVKTITNTLKKAAGQLPSRACNVIFLCMPERWSDDPHCGDALDKAIGGIFRNRGSVSLVMVLSRYYRLRRETGFATGLLFRPFHNSRAYIKAPDDLFTVRAPVFMGSGLERLTGFWRDLLVV